MNINQKINEIAVQYFEGNNVKFAEKMNTSEANIRNYRSKIVPKVDFLVKLHQDLEINFEWLLIDEGDMNRKPNYIVAEPNEQYLLRSDSKKDIQHIPLYDMEAAAGLVSLFEKKQNIIDYISIPNMPKCDGALPITGDSMYPLLKSGDIVIYKEIRNIDEGIFWGEMYLLSVNIDGDDLTLVKYIQRSEKGDEYIKLVSQNPNHQPKDVLLKKINALALIKASIRINSMS